MFRTALIGLGEPGREIPAIVVEPEKGQFPRGARAQEAFIGELRELGAANKMTRGIGTFFFKKALPVDMMHNAKIHRRTLALEYGRRVGGG